MENSQVKDNTQSKRASGEGPNAGGSSGRQPGSGPRSVDPKQIFERGREVWNEARGLASTVEEAFEEIEEYLREQMEQRPYAALVVASGVGYILGGGLPSRLTGLLVGWGSRIALTMAVQQLAPHAGVAAASSNPSSSTAAGRDQ